VLGITNQAGKDEDSDDEEEDDEEDDDDDEEPVNLSLARNEKNLGGESKTYIKQLDHPRVQSLVAYILGLSQDEFLEVFYKGHVYLNGKLLEKKARSLTRGDKVDIIQEIDDIANTKTVIRIVVMEIAKVPGKRVKMEVEVWKPGICIKETA